MVILNEKPQKPIVILGFPGFGMVGSIATEFLVEHLNAREIGKIIMDELPATVAIHNGKLVNPIGIYYNEEKNIVIVHAIVPLNGLEWKIADKLKIIFDEMNPWRIINLEGVGVMDDGDKDKVLYFTKNVDVENEMKSISVETLTNGIIVGISSSLFLKQPNLPLVTIFAPAHSAMPDSRASAKLIEFLDKYLKFNLNYQPLLDQAKTFEEKLKNILSQGKAIKEQADKKTLSYLG